MPAVFSVIGYSRSGKTTVMTHLIRHFRGRGLRVGAIKHTHHPLDAVNRGDTAGFSSAGAEAVMLAGGGQALIWRGRATPERVSYQNPGELPDRLAVELVLVEGFKSSPLGEVIAVEREGSEKLPSDVSALRVIRDARNSGELAELTAFLDRITS